MHLASLPPTGVESLRIVALIKKYYTLQSPPLVSRTYYHGYALYSRHYICGLNSVLLGSQRLRGTYMTLQSDDVTW